MVEIPDELKGKLAAAKSDNETCEILADGGVDLEAMERELKDEALASVNAGWADFDAEYSCPYCGEANRDNVSRQFWASLFIDSGTKYRCRSCDNYFYIVNRCVRKYA